MNGWDEKFELAASGEERDIAIIRDWFPRTKAVVKTGSGIDRAGVDYICELANGAVVCIDAKTRKPGCSKYWKDGPELAVELYSVKEKGVAGWPLSTSTQCDYVLYTFPPGDYAGSFLIPFQGLRKALHAHWREWTEAYEPRDEANDGYTSTCIFVPASVVLDAVAGQMEVSQ